MTQKANKPETNQDPFFGLKYIAYHRAVLPAPEECTPEIVANYARWQICKARNILWNDPIWDSYTDEEIMIEFFAITFDQSEQSRIDFQNSFVNTSEDVHEWMEIMSKKHSGPKTDKIDEGKVSTEPLPQPTEFEDKF